MDNTTIILDSAIQDPNNITSETLSLLKTLNQNDQEYLLRKSAELGLLELLKAILETFPSIDINSQSYLGDTALHYGTKGVHFNIVKRLLEHGADPYICNKDHLSPYSLIFEHYHPYEDDNVKSATQLMEILINAGVDINSPDENGLILLFKAAAQWDTRDPDCDRNTAIFKFLLDQHADSNIQNNDGVTPFIYACLKCSPEMIQWMIDYGADIHLCTKMGNSALLCAAQNPHSEVSQILLGLGLDLDKQNQKGETALMIAIKNRNFDTAHVLIDSGANIQLADEKQQKAIHYAVSSGDKSIINLLLEKGASEKEYQEATSKKPSVPEFQLVSPEALFDCIIKPTTERCDCCKKSMGYLQKMAYYLDTEEAEEEELFFCPWCIASGTASKKFNTYMNDIELEGCDEESELDQKLVEELRKKTPTFPTWQEGRWFSHCHAPCKFLGYTDWDEMQEIANDLLIDGEEFEGDLSEDPWLKKLSKIDGSYPTGYLFGCLHCQKKIMYYDLP